MEKEARVAIEFLSDEWTQAVQEALNANEAFARAVTNVTASIQQVVTSANGEKRYWFKLEGGKAALGTGDASGPVDATITQDYETAAQIMRSELNPVAAYMTGKLRVSGDLMKLMQLQGPLGQMPAAMKDLDIQYSG
jgi:putative sterol carrier protein